MGGEERRARGVDRVADDVRGDGDARGGRVFDQLARFEVLVER